MRWPKEFSRSGNRYHLENSNIRIYQWNTGKNKNFMIEVCDRYNYQTITIPGKGDEAMQRAIDLAHDLALTN